MSDYHSAKNVFGELTFGEYWNLVGCHAGAFRIKGRKGIGFNFKPIDSSIKFYLGDGSFHPDGSQAFVKINLENKAKAFGNKVVTKDTTGRETTIEFFELKPLEFEP